MSRQPVVAIVKSRLSLVLVFALAAFVAVAASGCASQEPAATTQPAESAPAESPQTEQAPPQGEDFTGGVTELQIEDIKKGDGKTAEKGKTVTVHYVGELVNGIKFDASKDRGEPFTFQLGAGQVIQGWDEGVEGMKVGGTRKLTIPADKGYGDQGAGTIPPGATLIFEVELLDVQ